MSRAVHRQAFSVEDYLSYERHASSKHEFWYGEVIAMAGGTPAHNDLASEILVALSLRLRGGPCRALNSDQRLSTPRDVLTYPDVSVYCGAVELRAGTTDTATNPTVLVEVLSPSTRQADLGEKLEIYKEIPTLHDVLLVEVDLVRVYHHYRTPAGWESRIADGADADVSLRGVPVVLPLREIYARSP